MFPFCLLKQFNFILWNMNTVWQWTKVALAGFTFCEIRVSTILFGNMVESRLFSFLSLLCVLLTGWYWETKDCSVVGEAKICNLYRAPVPADCPSGAGSRAFKVGTFWCKLHLMWEGKRNWSVLLQKAVCGTSEWSICGAQRKNKLETLESKVWILIGRNQVQSKWN